MAFVEDCFVHKLFIWDLSAWPLYIAAGHYSEVVVNRGHCIPYITCSFNSTKMCIHPPQVLLYSDVLFCLFVCSHSWFHHPLTSTHSSPPTHIHPHTHIVFRLAVTVTCWLCFIARRGMRMGLRQHRNRLYTWMSLWSIVRNRQATNPSLSCASKPCMQNDQCFSCYCHNLVYIFKTKRCMFIEDWWFERMQGYTFKNALMINSPMQWWVWSVWHLPECVLCHR